MSARPPLILRNPIPGDEDSDQYETPRAFFDLCASIFGPFNLDACAEASTAKCAQYYTAEDSCLRHPWGTREQPGNVWLNPPYSSGALGPIMRYACQQTLDYLASTLALFPIRRSEHAWFAECVCRGASLIMPVRGRIPFLLGGVTQDAPNHASVLVWYCRGHWPEHPLVLSFDRDAGLAPRELELVQRIRRESRC
jgi:phage N-6-adenine-methyltransferase